ncbi:MAG: hypothetical protein MR284_07520 [Clostridiales bacterium]|nr:hypothetical protein [Clostridiales bacterium]
MKKRIIHRRTMKKINITLCVVLALAVVSTMFLLMKRKEAIAQSDNAKLTYEDAEEQYSYDGLMKQDQELQEEIDALNSDISARNDEIADFGKMISDAEDRENEAAKFNKLAEQYLQLRKSEQ